MIVGRTLGQCVIEIGTARLGPESEVVFGAMLYLLSHAGRPVPRRALLELLWPSADEAHGRHCLRQTIYRLRRLGAPLDAGVERIGIPLALATLDHERITGCPAVLLDAPHLLLGAYLPAYAPAFSRAFGDWIEQQRTVVHARLCRATLVVIGELRTQGRFADAEALARVCLELDPLNEEATLVLAESAAMAGSKTEALGILDRYLSDVGGGTPELRLPATVLRRRIAERLPAPRYSATLAPVFVGRTSALAELTASWTESRAGTPKLCLMWGDAGIGKTRLASELTTMAVVQGARAERVACQPVDARRPLSVFVELVPRLLALRGAAGVSPESMGHLRRVTDVDTAGDTPEDERPDAAVRYAQVCRAIFDLLEAVSGEGSLVVVVEDAHWLDAVSWRLLAEIPRRCLASRLLIVLTSRVAPQALGAADAVAAAASCTPIHLLPLPDDDAGALVDSAAQRRSGRLSAEARASCVRRGAGNPFFLQELTAHVVAGRGMATLPLTVQTLLEERLASVRPRSAQALQAVVLLGRAATVDRVEALLEYKAHELIEALEELEAAGLLLIDGQTMGCRHELLAAEAVGRMAPASRLVLHRRAARVLEREIEESRSATWLWECAAHWAQASDGGRVVRLAVMCGEQLVEMGLPGEAAIIFDRTKPYCSTELERQEMLALQVHALASAGDWNAILREAAVDQSKHADVHHDQLELVVLEAKWRTLSSPGTLLPLTLECVHAETATAEHRARAAILGLVFAEACGDENAVKTIFHAATSATDSLHDESALLIQLLYHTGFGTLALACDAARELAEMLTKERRTLRTSRILRWASVPHVLMGNFDQALRLLEDAYSNAVRLKSWTEACPSAEAIAHLNLLQDDIPRAKHWCGSAAEWSRRSTEVDPFVNAGILVLQARLALTRQAAGLALEYIDQVRELCRGTIPPRPQFRLRAIEAAALRQLGRTSELAKLLPALALLHAECSARGDHDFEVSEFASALTHCGQHHAANAVWSQYTATTRRESYPLPATFQPMLRRDAQ